MLRLLLGVVCGVIGITVLAVYALPREMPRQNYITIDEGMGIAEIAATLDAADVVYSKLLTQTLIIFRGGERSVQAGMYAFSDRANAWDVTTRLLNGDLGIDPIVVRVPEGATRVEMAMLFEAELPFVTADEFLTLSDEMEGYLFPDTYYFVPTDTAERVIDRLRDTFDTKTADLRSRVEASGQTFDDIVIIGSLIEGEVADPDDRRLVSGVIQNRLAIDMALQLDASFAFLLGKESAELTRDDLSYESPYNTYLYPGLPPGPIGSPSLDAMEAAFAPTPSDYFYYLSASDGTTYFAEDFEGHKANRARYLD